MTGRRIWGLWLIITVLLLGPRYTNQAEVTAQAPGPDILRLVNQLRAGYGLPPFQWDANLALAAQQQANYMATHNVYSHVGSGGSTPQSRATNAGYSGRATENIVGGTDLSPSQGVTWWRNSPVHFNTMVSQQYIHAGVAVAQGHDQNFYALVVGSPASDGDQIDQLQNNTISNENLAPVVPVMIAEPREDGSIVHTVGQGQSFWAIAARYEITLEQLLLYNNLSESSVINPGDSIIIRLAEGQSPPPTATPPASHRVGDGDSLWTIAAWYNLSLPELLALNAMEEDSHLSPGDEVRIRLLPGESIPPTSTPQITHFVAEGDTLWDIAQRYALTLEQLLAYNAMDQSAVLSIGQALIVVAPTFTPIPTQLPTATPVATQTAEATLLPTSTLDSVADAPGPPLTATPMSVLEGNSASPASSSSSLFWGLLLSAGIAAIAVSAIVFLRRTDTF